MPDFFHQWVETSWNQQRPGRSRGRRPPRPPNSPGEEGWQKKMPTPMEFSREKNGNIVKQLEKPVENRSYSKFLPGIMTQLKPHDMGPCLGIANQTNSSHLSMAGWSYHPIPLKGPLLSFCQVALTVWLQSRESHSAKHRKTRDALR